MKLLSLIVPAGTKSPVNSGGNLFTVRHNRVQVPDSLFKDLVYRGFIPEDPILAFLAARWLVKVGSPSSTMLIENFPLYQTVPGAIPLTVQSWPDYLTQENDLVTVYTSPTLTPWVPSVLGTPFPVSNAMFVAKSFGGALNAILAAVTSGTWVQLKIGSRYSWVTLCSAATPTYTNSNSATLNELQPLSVPLTLNMPVRKSFPYSGPAMIQFEIVGGNLRFFNDGVGNFEDGAVQSWTNGALGYNDKWGFQDFTVNLGDVDEKPDQPAFTTVIGAPLNGVETFTYTFTGMAAAPVDTPYITAGLNAVRKNAVTTIASGRGQLNDVLAMDLTRSASYLTATSATLITGGIAEGGANTTATMTVITMPDPAWVIAIPTTPTVQAAGSTTTSFTGQAFSAGDAYVAVIQNQARTTAVVIGGVAATLVAESSAANERHVSWWRVLGVSAGTVTIDVTAGANMNRCAIAPFTIQNATSVIADTSIRSALTANPMVFSDSLDGGTNSLRLVAAVGITSPVWINGFQPLYNNSDGTLNGFVIGIAGPGSGVPQASGGGITNRAGVGIAFTRA